MEDLYSAGATVKYCAWIYPGAPATNAPDTYKKYKIDMLRPEYFTVTEAGILTRVDEDKSNLYATANAFSEANVAEVRKYSKEQMVTVSSGAEGMRKFLSNSEAMKKGVQTLVDFVVKYGLTGIDIDFEQFSSWTADDYKLFKSFMLLLGNSLHSKVKKLALCGPMWTSPFNESPFPNFDYKDFKTLPVDYISPMTYDYQYDYGGGAAVCPIDWLTSWAVNMKKLFPVNKLIMGIPSYGYTATTGKWDIKILTLEQIRRANGYSGGRRDGKSGEVFKQVGNKMFVSNDTVSLGLKRDALVKQGITMISVWHLGGNDFLAAST